MLTKNFKFSELKGAVNAAVIVAALGYFVDVYDIIIFGVVRVASLKDIGVPDEAILDSGVFLLNMQMAGMLLGGLLWGILGDKKGRISVLFGSIILYSISNIANAFVETVEWYAVWRFLAGIGLAGELGAGITLVAETIPKAKRGYSTTIVATVGIMGGVVAALVGKYVDWQTAYIVGGVMGLCLLAMRYQVIESGMFDKIKVAHATAKRGSLMLILKNKDRLIRYICCILIGLPVWFVFSILVILSPELAKTLGSTEAIDPAFAVLLSYFALSIGDLTSGCLSQLVGSRRKAVKLFLLISAISTTIYLYSYGMSAAFYYTMIACAGFGVGYWAVFVTIAAEQFGTNIRATVATTVPNFVRGSVIAITTSFAFLKAHMAINHAAAIVGAVCLIIAYLALHKLQETHGKDLDYIEAQM